MEAKFRLSKCHLLESTKYAFYNVILGVPAIMIFAVAASMAMGTEREGDGEVFRYFLCILSVFGTIYSFVYASTSFLGRSQQHSNAWAAYRVFVNDAEAALGRHVAGDRWLNATQHLELLMERWRDIKGSV